MIQPATRVLPSNAPPLRDRGEHTSPVLHEQSGNRQQSDCPTLGAYEPKYASVLLENSYPSHQQQPGAPPLAQPQSRSSHRSTYARSARGYTLHENDAWVAHEAKKLYRRFFASEQYSKYRTKQRKDDKGQEQKWPDHLEEAFFKALVKWPPMGRRKTMWKEKQRGRNELIADYIEQLTGEARTRKQVSSHIQVLKPFVEKDAAIMLFLSKHDIAAQTTRFGGIQCSGYANGRSMSSYPVAASPETVRGVMRQEPQPQLADLRRVKDRLDVFEPTDFQMFVQRKFRSLERPDEENVQRLHTYTASVSEPRSQDILATDWQNYPLLASMHSRRPLECNVLVAEASIAIPTETWKYKDDRSVSGIELGISFLCTSRHLPTTARVMCHNSFYRNGHYLKEQSGQYPVELTPTEAGGGVETQVKFGSDFWAKTLAHLMSRMKESASADAVQHKEYVHNYVRSITACQEVTVLSDHGPERVLVIYWTFRQSSKIQGSTSWRRFVLPPAPQQQYDTTFDIQAPVADMLVSQPPPLPMLQSPFEYDGSSGSALSSATWPTSISDASGLGPAQPNPADCQAADNNFDFTGGSIAISYDSNLTLDNFDSSTFNFDATSTDFAGDPALQDYGQQWYEGYGAGFGGAEQSFGEGTGYEVPTALYDGSLPGYGPYEGYEQQVYDGAAEQQAYSGAGMESIKQEDALAALADASYMAGTMAQRHAGA